MGNSARATSLRINMPAQQGRLQLWLQHFAERIAADPDAAHTVPMAESRQPTAALLTATTSALVNEIENQPHHQPAVSIRGSVAKTLVE